MKAGLIELCDRGLKALRLGDPWAERGLSIPLEPVAATAAAAAAAEESTGPLRLRPLDESVGCSKSCDGPPWPPLEATLVER